MIKKSFSYFIIYFWVLAFGAKVSLFLCSHMSVFSFLGDFTEAPFGLSSARGDWSIVPSAVNRTLSHLGNDDLQILHVGLAHFSG